MHEELPIKYYPVPVYSFVGRETELQCLKEKLEQHKVVAIVGMGGIGKTQLAGKYAMLNKHDYSCIYYFHAEIKEELILSIHQLAAAFSIPIKQNNESIEVNQILYNLYKIFDKNHALFIFDNIVDKELIQSLLPSAVGLSNSKIHILLTSRRSEWQNTGITHLHLTTFNQLTALQMFEKILGPKYDKKYEADWNELSKILGYLPLALQVSAFYIRKQMKYLSTFTLSKYIDIIKEEMNSVSDILFQDYDEIIYNSVKISLNMVKKETDSALALKLVNVLAHVGPTGIEEERLSAFVEEEDLSGNLNFALLCMLDHSIIFKQKDERLHMHEIIQQCVKYDQKRSGTFENYRALANTLHSTKPYMINKRSRYNKALELQQELNNHQNAFVPIYSNPNCINQIIYSSIKPIPTNKSSIHKNLLSVSRPYYNDTELLNEENPVYIYDFSHNFINVQTYNLLMIKS